MKLTKGKISKLYNKNKQTMRKRKHRGRHSTNTFRKRVTTNLANNIFICWGICLAVFALLKILYNMK